MYAPVGVKVCEAVLPVLALGREYRRILKEHPGDVVSAVRGDICRGKRAVRVSGDDSLFTYDLVYEADEVVAIPVEVVEFGVMARLSVPVDIDCIDVPVLREESEHRRVALPFRHLPVDEEQRGLVVSDLAVVYDAPVRQGESLFDGSELFERFVVSLVPVQIPIRPDSEYAGSRGDEREQDDEDYDDLSHDYRSFDVIYIL